ncbi:MAG: hypothetical protein CO108_00700 [Deltaproteobacteria bacterium CG_4_9_14_3_um_filter_63_12]|nr:MAG: hypothetical protein CO108_00700 [Deltaproteobacteria bacterium CG_4_9_14_3_um_filter_63_12]
MRKTRNSLESQRKLTSLSGQSRRFRCLAVNGQQKKWLTVLLATVSLFPLLSALGAAEAQAEKLKVVTTLPDLEWVVGFIGGDLVEVESLLSGAQDPHKIEPKPSLMAKLSDADLYVEIGLGLELWSGNLIEGARNANIQVGEKGHLYASDGITLLEKPAVATRESGDMHPYGNPHIWLDPLNMLTVGDNVYGALVALDSANTETYDANKKVYEAALYEAMFGPELVKLLGGDVLVRMERKGELLSFLEKKEYKGAPLLEKLGGWMGKAQPLVGKEVVFYHQSWIYFIDRFGLVASAYVEEKPGVAPSAAQKERLVDLIHSKSIPVIAMTSYYDDSIPAKLAKETGATLVFIPNSIGGTKEATDYFKTIDAIIDALVAH